MQLIGEDLVWYGGCATTQAHSNAYAYSTTTHKWRLLPLYSSVPAPLNRSHHSTVYDPITGIWLIVGGVDKTRREQLTASMVPTKAISLA